MDDTPKPSSREERLAEKLRDNLRKRKARARALDGGENRALPKAPPKS